MPAGKGAGYTWQYPVVVNGFDYTKTSSVLILFKTNLSFRFASGFCSFSFLKCLYFPEIIFLVLGII